MHELSVTQSILDLAVNYAQKSGATRVTDLNLVIGRLSSIVDDSVQFYWDIVAKGTLCEGSTLHFERIQAEIECLDCSKHYILDEELVPCPNCGSNKVKFLTGKEFRLDSIEVEND
jgi:hydrogenase nickel incorporation protein HypA/HybF